MDGATDGSAPAPPGPITIEVAANLAFPRAGSARTQAIVAPTELLSVAQAKLIEPGIYYVPVGMPMVAFLYATGPVEVTRYNFHVVRTKTFFDRRDRSRALVARVPYEESAKRCPGDSFRLTAVGNELLATQPGRLAYKQELACSGKSLHGKEPPNCWRKCGGIGACAYGCDDRSRNHGCSFRVEISASLQDVELCRFTVKLVGTHVPEGTCAVPPPLDGLKPASYVISKLTRDCLGGCIPTTAVNNQRNDVPDVHTRVARTLCLIA